MSDRFNQSTSANARLAAVCGAVVLMMTGAAYAAVPLYELFCRVTGFGGTVQQTTRAPERTLDAEIRVRFDANTQRRLQWEFEPVARQMSVQLGEVKLAHYRAKNIADHAVTGVAAFNVTPAAAAVYFNKMACFCFEEQTLQPGEEVLMPVQFFVDPEMAEDLSGQGIKEITLSYSFAEVAAEQIVMNNQSPAQTETGIAETAM